MDKLQQVFVLRAILDGDLLHDQHGKRRVVSSAELDAIADFRWPWSELKDVLAAGAGAVRSLWRARLAPMSDPSALSAEA